MSLSLGKFKIHVVSDGLFQLDGGSMFGMVPKMVWSKHISVDANNMALWGTHCLLIETGQKLVLIETGFGPKLNSKHQKMYARTNEDLFQKNLNHLGFRLEDIDIVIPTHFHLDHVGGFTDGSEGRWKPRFTKAKYFIQRREWEDATHPHRLSKGSYLPENFVPVVDAHQEEWLDGDAEILPGLNVFLTGAHTHGHQAILLHSEGETLFCGGDLIPSRWHVRQTFVTAYDLCPFDVMEVKSEWLEKARQEDWILHWYHDPTLPFGRVVLKDENFAAKTLEGKDGK